MLLSFSLTLVFFCGLIGIIISVYRKIPLLLKFERQEQKKKTKIIPEIIKKVKNIPAVKNFSIDGLLQKTLSRIKIIIMRIENTISVKLIELREKSRKKNAPRDDNYWKELNGEGQKEGMEQAKKKAKSLKKKNKELQN